MKLTGNLKKQVEKAETKEEMKSLIENAGMLPNDDELEKVSGGIIQPKPSDFTGKIISACHFESSFVYNHKAIVNRKTMGVEL